MKTIRKYAAAICRAGQILLVRKKGTDMFISPGGKPEAGETKKECLERELSEELGVSLVRAEYLGTFTRKSAFEDALVEIDIDTVTIFGLPKPCSEIEEIAWVDGEHLANGMAVGSIFAIDVIPSLIRDGLVRQSAKKINKALPNMLVFDIDGTIADGGVVSNKMKAALQKIKQDPSSRLAFATSRAPRGARKALGDLISEVPVICCNGSIILDETQKQTFVSGLSQQDVNTIVQFLEENGVSYFLEYGDKFAIHGDESLYPEMLAYEDKLTLDKESPWWDQGVIKISCRSANIQKKIMPLYKDIRDGVAFNFHGDDTAELNCYFTDKYKALSLVSGIEHSNLICFGNDDNDFTLLSNASEGYVIGDELVGLENSMNVSRLSRNDDLIIDIISQRLEGHK
ncbi:HAD hydrolase family protein [Photobacterium arenosum]|uniref:HAD hydrolase family protein n=1 Tax=Photobacterium arenosum TaxID=2774143 RepID=UPI00288A7C1B|nr:HAD hydrolase family protein [Photobacterium arenosum]